MSRIISTLSPDKGLVQIPAKEALVDFRKLTRVPPN